MKWFGFMGMLLGIWFYTSLIYQGNPMPRLDENLQMYFTFSSQTENELFYYRTNSPGHCRRTANYFYDKNKLYQKVTAVDPANAPECSADVDMQLGHESISEVIVSGNCMYLVLPLGEETLTYVWQKNP